MRVGVDGRSHQRKAEGASRKRHDGGAKDRKPLEAGKRTKEKPEDGSRRKSEVRRRRNRRTKPEGSRKVDRRNRWRKADDDGRKLDDKRSLTEIPMEVGGASREPLAVSKKAKAGRQAEGKAQEGNRFDCELS